MGGGETISKDTVEAALDEVAPVIVEHDTTIYDAEPEGSPEDHPDVSNTPSIIDRQLAPYEFLPRDQMSVHGPEDSSEDLPYVRAEASGRLAMAFSYDLSEALPEDYFVEIGRLGKFVIRYSP